MRKEKEVRYFSSFSDDFEQTVNQDFTIPPDYKWIKSDFFSKLKSGVIYSLAIIFSSVYCPLFLHMRVKGRKNLRGIRRGFFIYGNHTQPLGDVFIPAICVFPKRIYTVVSPANYGIPVIGKILPYLGALPIVDSKNGIKELTSAIRQRIKESHPIVIYPEAHVWEYYTGIRPFSVTSFKFPAKFDTPSFSMTVTYKKSKLFKKPKMDVYIDGPFYPVGNTQKEKAKHLHEEVTQTMKKRSKLSDFEYIRYEKAEEETGWT